MTVRVSRLVKDRTIRIDKRGEYARVYDCETGREVPAILIEYSGRIELAEAGQRISFVVFVTNEAGRPFLIGDRAETERWCRALVAEVL
jgi:hypothetical protein